MNREIKFNFTEVKLPHWQMKIMRNIQQQLKTSNGDLVEAIKKVSDATGHSEKKITKIFENKITLTSINRSSFGDDDSSSIIDLEDLGSDP